MAEHVPEPADAVATPASAVDVSRRTLMPKGSCWYCDKPVGDIRRFCGRACANAFEEEKEFDQPAP